MPTIPSIRTSVENKQLLVIDEHAKNGTFQTDSRGRLIAYTGGFSVVFPYENANGEKWAFRCWHADVSNTQEIYKAISDTIKKAKLPFLCDFVYVDKGINVDGTIYPTTRMRWIEGENIKEYICKNMNSSDKLNTLANRFLDMTHMMHKKSLAHGDLQHGNILVGNDERLYLVDYDSFYCPELKGESDNITGLPDYQHPARRNNKQISEKVDYFSELIIYLSIKSIAKNPSLVDKYKVEDSERLLFSKDDFADLKNSSIYTDIYSLGKEYHELLDVLEEYLKYNDISQLQPFETFLFANKIVFSASSNIAIRNKQLVTLKWNVPIETDIQLKKNGVVEIDKCDKKGQYSTTLDEDATYVLEIKGTDGITVTKQLTIRAFDECEISFVADKYYVFPTIPIILSWQVSNAKHVWLDDEEVSFDGTKVIEPDKAKTIVLSAEDEFGKKEKRIDIRMLPIPIVESLFVPTPTIKHNLSITIQQPKYQIDASIPNIEIKTIKTELSKVKSFTECGLNIELQNTQIKTGLKHSLQSVYNHIKRLIYENK